MKRIAEIAGKHGKVQTIVHHINVENLKEKHRKAIQKKAAGIDGVTKSIYDENLEGNLTNLMDRMKRQAYIPQDVKKSIHPQGGK